VAKTATLLLVIALFVIGAARPSAGETIVLDEPARTALAGLPSLQGAPLRPADLEDRVVVVAFFASWCPPCRPEFEHLRHLDQVYGERGVTIVSVNIFEQYLKDPAGVRLGRFLAAFAGGLHVVGGGEAVAPRFGAVDRIPTVFVFDRAGQSVMRFIHQQGATKTHATYEELAAAVEAAL
jgi:thiol-disulfide isomerase/thioredoxin